jgi:hypothetical protein
VTKSRNFTANFAVLIWLNKHKFLLENIQFFSLVFPTDQGSHGELLSLESEPREKQERA